MLDTISNESAILDHIPMQKSKMAKEYAEYHASVFRKNFTEKTLASLIQAMSKHLHDENWGRLMNLLSLSLLCIYKRIPVSYDMLTKDMYIFQNYCTHLSILLS